MKEVQGIGMIMDSLGVRKAAEDSFKDRRDYDSSKTKHVKQDIARCKMQIYFKDGNRRYFYSYDTHRTFDGKVIRDEYNGLSKLLKQIVDWYEKIQTVTIYANMNRIPRTDEKNYSEVVYRLSASKVFENDRIAFATSGKDTLMKLTPAKDERVN